MAPASAALCRSSRALARVPSSVSRARASSRRCFTASSNLSWIWTSISRANPTCSEVTGPYASSTTARASPRTVCPWYFATLIGFSIASSTPAWTAWSYVTWQPGSRVNSLSIRPFSSTRKALAGFHRARCANIATTTKTPIGGRARMYGACHHAGVIWNATDTSRVASDVPSEIVTLNSTVVRSAGNRRVVDGANGHGERDFGEAAGRIRPPEPHRLRSEPVRVRPEVERAVRVDAEVHGTIPEDREGERVTVRIDDERGRARPQAVRCSRVLVERDRWRRGDDARRIRSCRHDREPRPRGVDSVRDPEGHDVRAPGRVRDHEGRVRAA